MTAKLINENGVPKLYSDDATIYFRVFDTFDDIYAYSSGNEEVEHTIEVIHENEVVEFFFEDGYLQSHSSIYCDNRYSYPEADFKGYDRINE